MVVDPSAIPSGLTLPVPIDRRGHGGPTPQQVRGLSWRRSSRGLYVPAAAPLTVDQRILEAAVLIPASGAVTGWAALRWHGGTWFDGLSAGGREARDVTIVTAADDVRPQPGVEISHERLNPREVRIVRGIPVVVPHRAVFFEMRYASSVRAAVVAMDMAAADDLTTIDDVAAYTASHPGWTGVGRARDALPLADENSWSPWESRLRLVWMLDADRPRPLCNHPVFDGRGRLLGTPDLLDQESGAFGEYDGAIHLTAAHRSRDLRREGLLQEHGMEGFVVVADDMAHRSLVAARITATFERAHRVPASARAWTSEPPWWWQPSHTVQMRRLLRGRARDAVRRRQQLHAS